MFAGSLLIGALPLVGRAGNAANPDAVELTPLPQPREMARDMDRPVSLLPETRFVVDCPDPAALAWVTRQLKRWYGDFAPRPVAATAALALPAGDEAYALAADRAGVCPRGRSGGRSPGGAHAGRCALGGVFAASARDCPARDDEEGGPSGADAEDRGRAKAAVQFDTVFARALRMVGHDMKVTDYRDTGHVDHQVPPAWWIDN